MYKKLTLVLVLFGMMLMSPSIKSQDLQEDWKLGVQAWSFNRFTFYEAVDKTASLGLKYIEAYPGQKLSKDNPSVTFGPDMSAEIKQQVKKKLKDAGVTLINIGVVKLTDDESQCRKVFDFAKEMGIETIASEPPEEAFDMLDRLCQEYKIKLAVHNHPPPTHYWDPNTVLKVCNGRSKWIGACADTGHWMRSGVNPLEALKKLQGRIIAVHLKDLNEFGDKNAHDVPWGTGKADIKAILTELSRQNFKGTFSIEYEYNWENSIPDIQQCVAYFNKVASELKSRRAGRIY
jgi:sugar phosphate isomerase/epimerase